MEDGGIVVIPRNPECEVSGIPQIPIFYSDVVRCRAENGAVPRNIHKILPDSEDLGN